MTAKIILFKPKPKHYRAPDADAKTSARFGERGEGKIYVWDDRVVFAVQVAQVTNRPLLVRGPAGSGKSSLAPFVANILRQRFYNFTVTARTQARDMMWEFDALARLNDANASRGAASLASKVEQLHNYITPGMLWWAFDRHSARLRGAQSERDLQVRPCEDPGGENARQGAVVLLDEIDKADPDVPNNLLEVLGSRQFEVQETRTPVRDRQQPLILITTNDERELPRAFLRRCIVLHLWDKSEDELVEIAVQHFGEAGSAIYRPVAKRLGELRAEAEKEGLRPPSTAEYLDAVAACLELQVGPHAAGEKAELWEYLVEVGLSKQPPSRSQDRQTV
jgi:MoxR-like ATPase